MTGSSDVFRRDQSVGWPGSTSESLVGRLQSRQDGAWEEMLQLYGPAVYRWCRALGVQGEDLADVSQDVLAIASRSIDRFLGGERSSFRGWLWTLTRNRSVDHFRKRKSQPQAAGGSSARQFFEGIPDPDCSDGPCDSLEAAEPAWIERGSTRHLQMLVETVKQQVHPRTWSAFWRTVICGDTPEEASVHLGLSVNSVYLARSRVLSRLRAETKRLGVLDPGTSAPPKGV